MWEVKVKNVKILRGKKEIDPRVEIEIEIDFLNFQYQSLKDICIVHYPKDLNPQISNINETIVDLFEFHARMCLFF